MANPTTVNAPAASTANSAGYNIPIAFTVDWSSNPTSGYNQVDSEGQSIIFKSQSTWAQVIEGVVFIAIGFLIWKIITR